MPNPILIIKAVWKEEEHPRDSFGKFTTKGAGEINSAKNTKIRLETVEHTVKSITSLDEDYADEYPDEMEEYYSPAVIAIYKEWGDNGIFCDGMSRFHEGHSVFINDIEDILEAMGKPETFDDIVDQLLYSNTEHYEARYREEYDINEDEEIDIDELEDYAREDAENLIEEYREELRDRAYHEYPETDIIGVFVNGKVQGLLNYTYSPVMRSLTVNYLETAPHNRGENAKYRGVGTRLIGEAIKTCLDLGGTGAIELQSAYDARGFYSKLGMENRIGNMFSFKPQGAKEFLQMLKASGLVKSFKKLTLEDIYALEEKYGVWASREGETKKKKKKHQKSCSFSIDLTKSISKELEAKYPGGRWVTMKGKKVYIMANGEPAPESDPRGTEAKKTSKKTEAKKDTKKKDTKKKDTKKKDTKKKDTKKKDTKKKDTKKKDTKKKDTKKKPEDKKDTKKWQNSTLADARKTFEDAMNAKDWDYMKELENHLLYGDEPTGMQTSLAIIGNTDKELFVQASYATDNSTRGGRTEFVSRKIKEDKDGKYISFKKQKFYFSDNKLWNAPEAKKDTKDAKKKSKAKKDTKKKDTGEDIRSDTQKNHEVAYDAGEKIGGARKDIAEIRKRFVEERSTFKDLEYMEDNYPEIAEKLVVKKNIIEPLNMEQEYKKGVDVNVAQLKKLIYDRIAPKPLENTREARKQYMDSIKQLQRILEPIKTLDNLKDTIYDLSLRMRQETDKALRDKKRSIEYLEKNLNEPIRPSEKTSTEPLRDKDGKLLRDKDGRVKVKETKYTDKQVMENRKQYLKKAKEELKLIEERNKNPLGKPLGEKLVSFFTNYESANRSINTVYKKNMTWEKLLGKKEAEGKGKKKKKGSSKHRWERVMPAVIKRKGGRETEVEKPEDMIKVFGMRGVEFGNWVDDSSGKFHLVKCAEAFHDLADLLGIDDVDISFNGKLAMAFGARGQGSALAHYEPALKVINITKEGGAGSLAHEWGHALDNLMYQFLEGKRSIGHVTDSIEDMDTSKLKGKAKQEVAKAFTEVVEAIKQGDGSGVQMVEYKSKPRYSYTPRYKQLYTEHGMPETIKILKQAIESRYAMQEEFLQRQIAEGGYFATTAEKKLKNLGRTKTREINNMIQEIGYHHVKATGENLTQIPVPTGKSAYYSDMLNYEGGKEQYWATTTEMFARVFEAYVEDSMKKKKVRNDYLVCDTKTTAEDAPFPTGKEREMMTKAMDKLIKTIKKHKAIKKALVIEALQPALYLNLHKAWKEEEHPLNSKDTPYAHKLKKSISKELEAKYPGGRWVTMKGRKVYIKKDGTPAPETNPRDSKTKQETEQKTKKKASKKSKAKKDTKKKTKAPIYSSMSTEELETETRKLEDTYKKEADDLYGAEMSDVKAEIQQTQNEIKAVNTWRKSKKKANELAHLHDKLSALNEKSRELYNKYEEHKGKYRESEPAKLLYERRETEYRQELGIYTPEEQKELDESIKAKPFNPAKAKPEKFYTYSNSEGWSKRAVRGIPFNLGDSLEGFISVKQAGKEYAVYVGQTGEHVTSIYVTSSSSHGLDPKLSEEEKLTRVANIAKAKIQKIGIKKVKKSVEAIKETIGISPRYTEDGAVKKTMKVTKAEKKQKSKEKQGDFYAMQRGNYVKIDDAVPVKLHPDYEFFYYKEKEKNAHHVVEASTGLAITSGTEDDGYNKKVALERAKQVFADNEDRIKQAIKNALASGKKSPRALKKSMLYINLSKSISKELEAKYPGGRWVTMRGSKVYIKKDGSIASETDPRENATKGGTKKGTKKTEAKSKAPTFKETKEKRKLGSDEVNLTKLSTDGGHVTVMENSPYANGRHSVYEFLVDEDKRGKGIGTKLLKQVIEKYKDNLGGQFSSEASVAIAHKLGFRPEGKPEATLEEVLQMQKDRSSVNLVYGKGGASDGEETATEKEKKPAGNQGGHDSGDNERARVEQRRLGEAGRQYFLKHKKRWADSYFKPFEEGLGTYQIDNAKIFHSIIKGAKAHEKNEFRAFLSDYTVEDYKKDKKLFLNEDGYGGIAVTKDGNIVSVFKDNDCKASGVSASLLVTALKNGGKRLDCYDYKGGLPKLYMKFGFVPVARLKFNPQFAPDDWNYDHGYPDIVFFKHNGDSVEEVIEKMGTYEQYDLSKVPYVDDWDAGEALAKSILSGVRARYAYMTPNDSEDIFYIPTNRLSMPYQTMKSVDWDKVKQLMEAMKSGEAIAPIIIGYDYDIHDGHHRWVASTQLEYTHVPCIVGGTNELKVMQAKERYRELWKSVIPTLENAQVFPAENANLMFRGIGQAELDYIRRTGQIQSKGKGNDDDLYNKTVFSALLQQAEGYARSNYDLYNEPQAYVLMIEKPPYVYEDEKGELVSDFPIPSGYIKAIVPIAQDDRAGM